MMTYEEKLNKLPIWARLTILKLSSEVKELKEMLDTINNKDAKFSTGVVSIYNAMGPKTNVSDHLIVDFVVSNTNIRCKLRNEYGVKVLEINSDKELHIEPRAANCIYIR